MKKINLRTQLDVVRKGLERILLEDRPMTRNEMFPEAEVGSSFSARVAERLTAHGCLTRQKANLGHNVWLYSGAREKIGEVLQAPEPVLFSIVWPSERIAATALEPTAVESEALTPPPAIAGVKQPPPGASPEVVQEWIFTLLHAQTENLIYLRDRCDRMLSILEKLL